MIWNSASYSVLLTLKRLCSACIRISVQDYTAKIIAHHKWKCSYNKIEVNKLCISTVNKLSIKSVNCPPLMTFWLPSDNIRLSESNFAVSKIYRKTLVYFPQNLHFLEIIPLQNINLVSVNNVSQHCLFLQIVTSNTFSSAVWTYYSNLQFCPAFYVQYKRWCGNSAFSPHWK